MDDRCAGPSPNIVSRVGSGPQFAGASGTGTQVANAVSGPGLQQQNLGTNSPVPDLFNTPGFTDGIGGFGKRRLQQSLSSSSSSGEKTQPFFPLCPILVTCGAFLDA